MHQRTIYRLTGCLIENELFFQDLLILRFNGEKVQYDTDPGTNIWERLLFDFVGMLPIEDQL
jgi:hypothetical protein